VVRRDRQRRCRTVPDLWLDLAITDRVAKFVSLRRKRTGARRRGGPAARLGDALLRSGAIRPAPHRSGLNRFALAVPNSLF
jgi:hypothetical protein